MIDRLKNYLDENRIRYITKSHSPAYTSQETAASAHVPGIEVAKTVIIKVDGRQAMAVLPASHLIDFKELKEGIGAERIELADEKECGESFPESECGAMPPFGNLFGLEVYVSESLSRDPEIVFNAGNFRELVRISYSDYEKLVRPKVLRFTYKQHGEKKEERPVHG